jgi:hypothetical protein
VTNPIRKEVKDALTNLYDGTGLHIWPHKRLAINANSVRWLRGLMCEISYLEEELDYRQNLIDGFLRKEIEQGN